MADVIQLRGDTSTNWTTTNPILKNREVGIETNTNKFKIGNGVDTWSVLPYFTTDANDVDHGLLQGLSDDDHPQYHNNTRGDVRYYLQSAVDTLLSVKLNTADLAQGVKDNETLTSLSLNANILTFTDEAGTPHNIDLSLYLDDTNLARIVSGVLDPVTGIATFTRNDATTFTLDMSALNDQTYINTQITNHESATDPHPQYTTETEVNSLIQASGGGDSIVPNTLVVSAAGNDTTGERNNWSKPYLTLAGALVDVQTGDFIYAFPSVDISALPNVPSDVVVLIYDTANAGDRGLKIIGEAGIGSIEKPSELTVGEGDSYTNGMVVLTSDGTDTSTTEGNLTDVSTEAKVLNGTGISFEGATANHCIYIGSERTSALTGQIAQVYGIKYKTLTARIGGNIDVEYWDGSAWTYVCHFCVNSGKFYRYGKTMFLRANTSDQMMFGIYEETVSTPKTINSKNLAWIRLRITDTLTQIPTIDQIKIHSNRVEAEAYGISSYGLARYYATTVQTGNVFGEIGGAGSVYKTIGATNPFLVNIKNSELNSTGDAISFQFPLPRGVDTSLPLHFKIAYTADLPNTYTGIDIKIQLHGIKCQGNKVADPSGGVEPVLRSWANSDRIDSGTTQVREYKDQTFDFASGTNYNKIGLFHVTDFSICDLYEGDYVFVYIELDNDGPQNMDTVILGVEVECGFWTIGGRGI